MTITMYGADWCGDCRRAKQWFAESGVPYTYIDLIEHPDENDVVLARNDGKQAIPVIIFDDDSHLTEPTNDDLAAKISELGDLTARVVERPESARFEMLRGGEVVTFADYSALNDTTVVVPHVATAPEHRGQGNAAVFMEGLLGLLRSSKRSIVPVCSYAASYIETNAQHHDLVAAD